RSFRVVSLDIDPDRGPDMVGDIVDFDFGGRAFDVVVMAEVLEHVRQPDRAIKAVHGILKPGGSLILSAPFVFPIHDRPDDYYRFTRYGLEWLLGDFSEVAISERNSWAEALNVVFVRLIKEKSRGLRLAAPLIVALAAVFQPFAMVLGRLVKTDFATSGYVARAVK
ncbi:MAG: class I SAM-dependent methyltransferase, partial [Rhodospirillales bacterium]